MATDFVLGAFRNVDVRVRAIDASPFCSSSSVWEEFCFLVVTNILDSSFRGSSNESVAVLFVVVFGILSLIRPGCPSNSADHLRMLS